MLILLLALLLAPDAATSTMVLDEEACMVLTSDSADGSSPKASIGLPSMHTCWLTGDSTIRCLSHLHLKLQATAKGRPPKGGTSVDLSLSEATGDRLVMTSADLAYVHIDARTRRFSWTQTYFNRSRDAVAVKQCTGEILGKTVTE